MADPVDLALYTVGWIAPMALELAPAVALLDEYVRIPIPEDGTIYHAERVGGHYVVMVVCPRTGTSPASATVVNLCRSFPNVKHVLVVGIAGGMPRYGVDDQEQIVLGDIVVGVPQNRDGGVAHYEFGTWDGDGSLSVRGHMLHPSCDLLIALNNLQNEHMQKGGNKISQFLKEIRNRLAVNEVPQFQDPGPEHDYCFNDEYSDSDRAKSCQSACDYTRSLQRVGRGQGALREIDNPRVHYGTIGSANTLVKSSAKRNELSTRHNIICFEMESSGVMGEQQGLVIRGISDYADSRKNKRWQKYAAATAASCAKELLLLLPKAKITRNEVSNVAIHAQGDSRVLRSTQAFVVFQDYGPGWSGGTHFSKSVGETPRKPVEDGYPLPNAESTTFVYPGIQQTMEGFLKSLPYNHDIMFPRDKSWPQEIQAPYLSVYHHRESFFKVINSVQEPIRKPWNLFVDYLKESFQAEYSEVDPQFQRGFVSPQFLKYLIKPGDILHYPSHRTVEAVQVVSALSKAKSSHNTFSSLTPRNVLSGESDGDIIVSHADAQEKPRHLISWSIDFAFWSFGTTFKRERGQVQLEMSVEADAAVPIRSLTAYPFRLADKVIQEKIAARGAKLWKFRNRGCVEYSKDEDVHAWSSMRSRYMIDPLTYRLMHQTAQTGSTGPSPDDLPDKQFQSDDCPAYPFLVLLPRIVLGYNFTEKKWVDLELDYVKDVEWNTKAFENLVTETEIKELLEALVKNQLKLETSTDLIAGKGNGLIILLHGGLGTGKTYMAESVAEYARKPLYRVTCGDIGTKPIELERHLETVLRLGRIWGCVVLLDEADIFLEERTLSDLDRNTLVSVFLRVLEYYTGILILTSNRVGHFDKAFRSRIQLALHYESLDQEQRHSIWANFIKHLYNSDSCRMDFADLQLNINNLIKEEMNGRQIRNAITTARHYADFKDKPLNYEVIKKVITISRRFDRYLHDVKKARRVKNGTDDDEIARDAGAR